MDNPAHVALVDAHAEGDGGTDDLHVVLLELLLRLVALRLCESCVIGCHADALFLEHGGHCLGVLAAEAVDDAWLRGTCLDEVEDEALLLGCGVASFDA